LTSRDIRDALIDCVISADELLPGLVAQILEYVAHGEFELAIDLLFEYAETPPKDPLLRKMVKLADELDVKTGQYFKYWRTANNSSKVYGPDNPVAVRNTSLPVSWTQEDVDACVDLMLEDGLDNFKQIQLTGRIGEPFAKNGTSPLYWIIADVLGEQVSIVADPLHGKVISNNQVFIDASSVGKQIRNLLLQVAKNPELQQGDFSVTLHLIGNGEWGAALAILCTQLYERGAAISKEELRILYNVGKLVCVNVDTLLGDLAPYNS